MRSGLASVPSRIAERSAGVSLANDANSCLPRFEVGALGQRRDRPQADGLLRIAKSERHERSRRAVGHGEQVDGFAAGRRPAALRSAASWSAASSTRPTRAGWESKARPGIGERRSAARSIRQNKLVRPARPNSASSTRLVDRHRQSVFVLRSGRKAGQSRRRTAVGSLTFFFSTSGSGEHLSRAIPPRLPAAISIASSSHESVGCGGTDGTRPHGEQGLESHARIGHDRRVGEASLRNSARVLQVAFRPHESLCSSTRGSSIAAQAKSGSSSEQIEAV